MPMQSQQAHQEECFLTARTCAGVHSHSQQQPFFVLCFGKPKVSPKNFQSPRTSTKTDFVPKDVPACFALALSVFLQAVSSCRVCGWRPKKQDVKLHLTTSRMSSQLLGPICFLEIAVIGKRSVWYGSLMPGTLRLKVSIDSVLS